MTSKKPDMDGCHPLDSICFASPIHINTRTQWGDPVCSQRRPRSTAVARNRSPFCSCASPIAPAASAVSTPGWLKRLIPSAFVEHWTGGTLHFGIVVETFDTNVKLINAAEAEDSNPSIRTVSHGEIVSVWSKPISTSALMAALDISERLLETKGVHPRLLALYSERSRGARIAFNSAAAGRALFPKAPVEAATMAAARILAAESARFRRAAPGMGWRANTPAVAATREATAFVAAAREAITGKRDALQRPEARPFLNALEVCAASSASPTKPLARVLRELEYEATPEAAAKLLGDLGQWARVRGASSPLTDPEQVDENASDDIKSSSVPEWTFPASILELARELRNQAHERRSNWLSQDTGARRSLLEEPGTVFCVDDRNTNFLDDALSVHKVRNGFSARISVHIADVAGLIEPGSPIDALARDRAQSMYLPLRPLHMLPPPVMEAASFSTTLPTEAITVQLDFDLYRRKVVRWEVFPSVVPPVERLSYDEVDQLLQSNSRSIPGLLNAERCNEIRALAHVAPQLAAVADRRRQRSERRDEGAVSGVRLVRHSSHGREYRETQVSTYRSGGAHAVVADLLASAGAVIREHAIRARVPLPEGRGAHAYAMRCGTAPMRRYADLATQRQVRGELLGKSVADEGEMDALRAWLVKRTDAVMKTVQIRRKITLFEALADTCARQRAASVRTYAVVIGRVGTISVSKRGVINVGLMLLGIGIETQSTISKEIKEEALRSLAEVEGETSKAVSATDRLQSYLRSILPAGSEVRVRIDEVNTEKLSLSASVISLPK